MTIKQLAEETGLSLPFFPRIENGLVMPSVTTLKTIADVLKVDIASFFQKEEDKGYIISHPGSRRIVRSKRGSFSSKVKPFIEQTYPLIEANLAVIELQRGNTLGRSILIS